MKAILINSENKTIEVVNIRKSEFLNDAYQHLNCTCIDAVSIYFEEEHSLYIDDESRLTETHQTGFRYEKNEYIGHGLIVGFDPKTGNNKDFSCTLEEVKKSVTWFNREDIDDEPKMYFMSIDDLFKSLFFQ